MNSGLHLEGMRVSKKEIADLMLQEKDMELEDQIEVLNNQITSLTENVNGIGEELHAKVLAEVMSDKDKMKAIDVLVGSERIINVTIQLCSGHNIIANNSNISPSSFINHRGYNNFGGYGSRGKSSQTSDPSYHARFINIQAYATKQFNGVALNSSVGYAMDPKNMAPVQEFQNAMKTYISQVESLEKQIQALQEERRNLSKNSKRVTSKIMKAQLSETVEGKRIVDEIESIVGSATQKVTKLAAPAAIEVLPAVSKSKKKTSKKK